MSFENMLKSLQQEYLTSIPSKIKTIEEQIHAKDTGNLRESFHKLKGTGRTYGLPEVSDLAEVAEEICIEHPVNSLAAGALAVAILRDIYNSRNAALSFDLSADGRMQDIRKLLQK